MLAFLVCSEKQNLRLVRASFAVTRPDFCSTLRSHPTSHLELHEQAAYQHLMGFSKCEFGSATAVPTFEDVKSAVGALVANRCCFVCAVLTTFSLLGAHWQQPSSLILELPMREIGS
jgi:hypothetical protein